MNERFWTVVKDLVKIYKSPLKPCKFYAANKELVGKEFKKNIKNINKDGTLVQNNPKIIKPPRN